MERSDLNKAYELLTEKYNRHEQILIQAYKSIKEKEEAYKKLNDELQASEEELKAINEELFEKNEIIQSQNAELITTLQHLSESQARLMQSDKMASLGILTAGVAHEINNPLNFIMGAYIGLENYFKERGSEKDGNVTLFLEGLKTGIDRASEIVKGLNQFGRDNKSCDEDCEIHAILDNCLVMIHNQIKHQIQIVKNYNDANLTIKGNVGNLHQAFVNIITNAYQSIENQGQIIIKTFRSNSTISVEVIDNGTGISEENLSKITDPFFTTKKPGKGTGLGLSITYNIIQDHNGELEFESIIGRGTTARIILPGK